MKRLLAILALCFSSVMAQQVVDTDIVHFLQTTEKCISYDETGAGATVAVFIDDDCDNVRDATEMYLSQEASFIWLNDHRFSPTVDQVAVTIEPATALSVFDLLQMFDVDGNEALSVSAEGNTDLGNPPASDARLNIQGAATDIVPLAPDVIGTPFLWFRADDVTGCTNGGTCAASVACEFRDFGSAPDNCYGVGLNGEATWRDGSLNGHDTIERSSGINPTLVLTATPDSSYSMTGQFTAVFVYDPSLVAQPATSSEVGTGEWTSPGQDSVVKIPGVSDSSLGQVSDTGSASAILSSLDNCDGTQPTCDGDPRIFIMRRTGASAIDGYGTLDSSGQPVSYGTASASLGTVILQSLLTRNSDASPDGFVSANFRLAEFILYNGTSISDSARDSLYQYLAIKYSLPTIGGSSDAGDMIAGYSSSDVRVLRTDVSGRTGFGSTDITNLGARVHIRDTSTQLRLEYDADNSCTWVVSSGGDLTLDCSGNNVTIEGVDATTLDDPQYLVSVAANPPLANADVVAQGTGIAYTNGTNTATFALRYTDTTSSNTLAIRECEFTTSSPAAPGTNGGGFICEGNTANGNEALHLFPNKDPADGSVYWIVEAEDISADDEVAVAVSNESSVWTPMTDSNGTAQCLQYDTATNAFSTGTNAPVNAEYITAEDNTTLTNDVFPSADNQTPISSAVGTAAWSTIPLCDATTGKTNFDGTAWVCNTDAGSAGTADEIRVEDGDNAGTFTAMVNMDMDDSGDINFVRAAGPPDVLTAEIRADAVGANEIAAGAVGTSEAAALDAGDVTTGVFVDALVDGSAEADEVVLVGDVDGAANANDFDEVNTEAEVESVNDLLDFQDGAADACSGSEVVRRNAGDSAFECVPASTFFTAWDDIADPDAAATIVFAGFDQDITSAEDGGDILTIGNTDADQAADSKVLRLYTNDTNDTNTIFLEATTDEDGTPATEFRVKNTGTAGGLEVVLGSSGVVVTTDGDGAITLLGQSTGADEAFTLNLDDTTDQVVASSSTGVTDFDFGTIDVNTDTLDLTGTGTINGIDAIDATSETTLETTLDIGGEVTSTGMSTTVIGDSITVANWIHQTSLQIPNGTGPTVDAAGEIAQDTTDDQFLYGATPRVLAYTYEECRVIDDLASSDDNWPVIMAGDSITITAVGCLCIGTCTTVATLSFKDVAGNAITDATPTCVDTTTVTYDTSIADGDASLVSGEALLFDVTGTDPSPNGEDLYMICARYTVNRQ